MDPLAEWISNTDNLPIETLKGIKDRIAGTHPSPYPFRFSFSCFHNHPKNSKGGLNPYSPWKNRGHTVGIPVPAGNRVGAFPQFQKTNKSSKFLFHSIFWTFSVLLTLPHHSYC